MSSREPTSPAHGLPWRTGAESGGRDPSADPQAEGSPARTAQSGDAQLVDAVLERLEAQAAEIARLSDALALSRARQAEALREAENRHARTLKQEEDRRAQEADAARAEIARRDRQLQELGACVVRQSRQISFRDDKIGWLTQDRDRFRARYLQMISSLSWRLTRPLRWGGQDAVLPSETGAEASGNPPRPDRTPRTDPPQDEPPFPCEPADLPEAAQWVLTRLEPPRQT